MQRNNKGMDKTLTTKRQLGVFHISQQCFSSTGNISGQVLPTTGVCVNEPPDRRRSIPFSPIVHTLSHYTPHCCTHQTFVNLILKYVTRYCACSQQKLKSRVCRKVNPNVSSKASGDQLAGPFTLPV